MKSGVFKHIEEILQDYPRLPAYIQERRQELLNPYHAGHDENVGGGKIQFKYDESTAYKAIDLMADREIKGLEKTQRAVAYCLDRTDAETMAIINELYFKAQPKPSLQAVSMRLNISRPVIGRKRQLFFEAIGKELGYLY
ncbi:transcriptional regulator [uncultured Secundilactobacillus sp.]|uniref:transcriptional regulator n=1 Tax=uncultured Secundilactobacillus sp. TaxID=2813935 RepID=UPI002588B6D8|nr:transcriptional regulator [uncultured Secundilactobacillus sp.]